MKKHFSFAVARRFSCALLCVAMSPALVAQINAVYVESNISSNLGNTILGFSNDGFGNLAPLPNSPYLTQGSGWGSQQGLGFQQDDDQQIVTDPSGGYMFAVNGHSNTISSFSIHSDGSLSLIGTPISSAGTQPASLGYVKNSGTGGDLLVAVNKSSDLTQTNSKDPNLVSFRVNGGVLTANLGSKVVFPTGSSPSQALMTNGKIAMVDEFLASPSQVGVYRIHADGTFHLITSEPVPPNTSVFLGLVANPVSNYIYAALPVEGAVAIYSYVPATGIMSFVSIVYGPGALPCWLAINQAGTRIYTGDTASNSVSVFDVSNPTAPAFLQQLTLSTEAGNGAPWNLQVDPTGKFLYAITGNGLHTINIQSDGTLAEIASPTSLHVPANAYPYGMATLLK